MSIDTEYTVGQINYLCKHFYLYPKYEIHLNRVTKSTSAKITIYIDRLKITYKNSESIGLIFFKLLVLKNVIQ